MKLGQGDSTHKRLRIGVTPLARPKTRFTGFWFFLERVLRYSIMTGKAKIESLIKNIQKDVLLAPYTTFKIGGPAEYFLVARTKEELVKVIKTAQDLKIPYFILGGGSKMLISDRGFSGLVVKTENQECEVRGEKIIAEAGVPLARLVELATQNSLSGLEFGVGIPGTIGGAVHNNAGIPKDWIFGRAIGDQIESVTLLMADGKIKTVNRKWMEFGYRESRLKRYPQGEKPVILSVVLRLKKAKKATIERLIKEKVQKRKEKIPPGPSVGCIFKNPPNSYAGLLIDKCGLKGKQIGKAQISPRHANFIINLGDAKAEDVLRLINLAKREVRKRFGLELREEVQYLGF